MDVWTLVIVVVSVLVALAIPVVIAVARVARRWSIEKRSPLAKAEARVVEKRAPLTGGRPETQTYYVTFEFPTGQRLELEVPGRDSGVLVIGDQGTLAWQGPRYLGFVREVLR
ncbi:MAG: DUF2500 domain-containing protein [Propionicimonas sp.]